MNQAFADDVRMGLTASPKALPSRYFYDAKGDVLFQQIMALKEYYPTRSEFEIFSQNKTEICEELCKVGPEFDLVELGAGDGLKTKVLLRELLALGKSFSYRPIDISASVLEGLKKGLAEELPELDTSPLVGEYFSVLKNLSENTERPKVVLFLGSNIGNFQPEQAVEFLKGLASTLRPEDRLMIGLDLKKDPEVILAAYNDAPGVTRAFNLNLLERINREFEADFDIDQFQHFPTYDPLSGDMKSFLVSRKDQTVNISALDLKVDFRRAEPVYMELSKKFDQHEVEQMANKSGFEIDRWFMDCRHWFTDVILVPKP